MSYRLHILEASGKLTALREEIAVIVNVIWCNVSEKIHLPEVDIVIDDDALSTIPEEGIGGFSPSANILYIHINTKFASIKDELRQKLSSTLTHELHHCARWNSVGYGNTLLETMVSEGLADHFDVEINGGESKPWSTAVPEDKLEILFKKAEAEFTDTAYDHSSWFYGSETIPRWAAYSLGYKIVSDYLRKTGKTTSELVDLPANNFIR